MRSYTGSTSHDDRATRGNNKGKIMVNLKENHRDEEEINRLNKQCIQFGKPPHYDLEKAKENIEFEKCLTYEEAFEKVFGESMERFNQGQKRKDRKTSVEKELEKLQKGKAPQELIHCMIVQIGNEEERPSKEECIEILKEYREEFKKNFPNMEIVSCSIHLDEATPHLQIYYVPFKTKEKQTNGKKWSGMDKQPSMSGALEQMGYTNDATVIVNGEEKHDYKNGALAQFQRDFNGLLDKICLRHDIEVNHYMRGQKEVEHQDTLDYQEGKYKEQVQQAKKEANEATREASEKKEEVHTLTNQISELELIKSIDEEEVKQKDIELAQVEEELTQKSQEIAQKEAYEAHLNESIENKTNTLKNTQNSLKMVQNELTTIESKIEQKKGLLETIKGQLQKVYELIGEKFINACNRLDMKLFWLEEKKREEVEERTRPTIIMGRKALYEVGNKIQRQEIPTKEDIKPIQQATKFIEDKLEELEEEEHER